MLNVGRPTRMSQKPYLTENCRFPVNVPLDAKARIQLILPQSEMLLGEFSCIIGGQIAGTGFSMKERGFLGGVFCLLLLLLCLCLSAVAKAQDDPFYRGKTIRIVVGSTPGGFYDRWARLLAKSMVKHIPGQPEIVVQNMPGAG
jgi:hypothetical protein